MGHNRQLLYQWCIFYRNLLMLLWKESRTFQFLGYLHQFRPYNLQKVCQRWLRRIHANTATGSSQCYFSEFWVYPGFKVTPDREIQEETLGECCSSIFHFSIFIHEPWPHDNVQLLWAWLWVDPPNFHKELAAFLWSHSLNPNVCVKYITLHRSPTKTLL